MAEFTSDATALVAAGLSPLNAEFYAARNRVIAERNAKVKAATDAADTECQQKLAALREQYNTDRGTTAQQEVER